MAKRLVFFALILLASCTQAPPADYHAQKSDIIAEVNRLESLGDRRNLTGDDISALGLLVENTDAGDEYSELKWMIGHGFQEHAIHSLQSISDTVQGRKLLCPFDPLSHVSLYLQYNETGRAIDSAREGAAELPGWQAKAEALHAENESYYPGLPYVLASMRQVIKDMDMKDYASARNDSERVMDNGYC